jgi:hypothetical protein
MAQGRRAALVVAACLAVARAETASTEQLSDPDVMEMDAIEAMTERSTGRRLQFGLDPNNEPLAGLGRVISQKYGHQVSIQPVIPCTLTQRFAWGVSQRVVGPAGPGRHRPREPAAAAAVDERAGAAQLAAHSAQDGLRRLQRR